MFDAAQYTTHRRGFLARLAGVAGIAAITPSRLFAQPAAPSTSPEFEAWLNRIKGAHRIVFDAPGANGGMPVVWPRVYVDTMNGTYGTKAADDTAVVILRHEAAALALNDAMWFKYKLGAALKIDDAGKPATRNPFAVITGLPIPNCGVVEVLKTGVLVGVCDVALSVLAGNMAKAGGNADAIKKEFVASIYAGVQVVPSGVMAVGRAQEKGCNYCFAG